MKNKLEQLLNSLIEKGWKPFGTDNKVFKVLRTKNNWWYFDGGFGNEICFSLREIVSKESNLWQFVCEMSAYNNYNKEKGKVLTWKKFEDDKYQINRYSNGGGYIQDYEYRLIESSLKDESELEEFLLNSIKLD